MGPADRSTSVSYTHLDVYKRQETAEVRNNGRIKEDTRKGTGPKGKGNEFQGSMSGI